MSHPNNQDQLRTQALAAVDRARTFFRACIVVAALVEAAGLLGLVLFADFKDPTHRLVLVQTLLVYGTLGLGILAIGILVRQGTLQVLAAIESGIDAD